METATLQCKLMYTLSILQDIVLSILDVVMKTATLQCKLMYTVHDILSGYRSIYDRYVMETAILYSVN